MVMPLVRGKVKLFGIIWLQAQAGYVYNRMGEWKTYTEKEVFNAPKADHSGAGYLRSDRISAFK